MALDNLTGELIVFTRDEIRDRYLRDYSLRNPAADIGVGSIPYLDASTMADTLVPLYANSVTIGNNVAASTKTGQALDDEATLLGTGRLPAVGASGYVTVTASAGGTTIFAGDEIKISGLRYQCTATSLYLNGDQLPIQGTDTGPATNQPAGAVMTWTNPRIGCASTAVVVLQADGTGLSDGRDVESDGDLNARLISLRANPPASGNDAAYQAAVLEAPRISVQQAFTYPCIKGPGTTGIAFTLRPATPGANRIPTPAQIASVGAWLTGQFPADDGIFLCSITADPTNIALKATWAVGVDGWIDAQPWPVYASPMVSVSGAVTPTAVTFRLTDIATAPPVGQTIAFYDAANGRFRAKKILTATLAGSDYDIVCDTSNASSDTSYVPLVGQPACPHSLSLNALISPVVLYFDSLGPGEQVSSFFDPGLRQKRSPPNPQYWASSVTNRVLSGLFAVPQVQDVSLYAPSVPTDPGAGTAGVLSHMLTLGSLVAFP